MTQEAVCIFCKLPYLLRKMSADFRYIQQNAEKENIFMEIKYDLSRFVIAHQRDYQTALSEIKGGRKTSHWMWYIFPQIEGLGFSSMSQLYAIKDDGEAKAFLDDPYLGANLREICEVLYGLGTSDALEVFGRPDDMKLCSCMTLFDYVSGEGIFGRILEKFFDGKRDSRTLEKLI